MSHNYLSGTLGRTGLNVGRLGVAGCSRLSAGPAHGMGCFYAGRMEILNY